MSDQERDPASREIDDRESQPGSHEISNLLLAARLRVHALRAESDPAARGLHLDAIDECIAQAIEIMRSHD